ncbi:M23 family metallopeptidase [Alkalimarinus alittae]|uniref:M23 family metallopeptidase n=1 Tax=Alkalimarinus alittae TaxID=2961619 RepID=A0ABY6MXN6_9ALTE|nr:M23 family metallopeptidase [Alkalimarinus alittae]UZE94591.1 M23 family metallopeptidase [Alkalimarinus alittae]
MPERVSVPVLGATTNDWNKDSFWYEPWGSSGVHKGIDIFGKKSTPVVSTVDGLVLYQGNLQKGGNVVLVLGPKWRLHYYAHLESIGVKGLAFVKSGSTIGSLGDSGNAKGKPPHLHYSIVCLLPRFWSIDRTTQGYKKAIFLDPNLLLVGS